LGQEFRVGDEAGRTSDEFVAGSAPFRRLSAHHRQRCLAMTITFEFVAAFGTVVPVRFGMFEDFGLTVAMVIALTFAVKDRKAFRVAQLDRMTQRDQPTRAIRCDQPAFAFSVSVLSCMLPVQR